MEKSVKPVQNTGFVASKPFSAVSARHTYIQIHIYSNRNYALIFISYYRNRHRLADHRPVHNGQGRFTSQSHLGPPGFIFRSRRPHNHMAPLPDCLHAPCCRRNRETARICKCHRPRLLPHRSWSGIFRQSEEFGGIRFRRCFRNRFRDCTKTHP